MVKNSEICPELSIKSSPLLKWAGGKRKLLSHILPLLPATFQKYFEPFVGGGALFFALAPRHAYLSDKNTDLINAYIQVRDRPEEVLKELRRLKNGHRAYYAVRSATPTNSVTRAARLVYLTTLAFNGLYRVNLRGEFNVPYGRKKHLDPSDAQKIHNASTLLSRAALEAEDFEKAVERAGEGDLVYLDPPYTVAHANNGFIKYNAKIFSWDDQIRLARVAKSLAARKSSVIVSNADHPSIDRLYDGFGKVTIQRKSVIAASKAFRGAMTECIYHIRP